MGDKEKDKREMIAAREVIVTEWKGRVGAIAAIEEGEEEVDGIQTIRGTIIMTRETVLA